jgi:hypothetical protein
MIAPIEVRMKESMNTSRWSGRYGKKWKNNIMKDSTINNKNIVVINNRSGVEKGFCEE